MTRMTTAVAVLTRGYRVALMAGIIVFVKGIHGKISNHGQVFNNLEGVLRWFSRP